LNADRAPQLKATVIPASRFENQIRSNARLGAWLRPRGAFVCEGGLVFLLLNGLKSAALARFGERY
jgi:hypothetical protein